MNMQDNLRPLVRVCRRVLLCFHWEPQSPESWLVIPTISRSGSDLQSTTAPHIENLAHPSLDQCALQKNAQSVPSYDPVVQGLYAIVSH